MGKKAPTQEPGAAGEAANTTPAEEPANIAVFALEARLKIGAAIVAPGPVDFPLKESEAKALERLGKVRIVGLF